MLVARLVDCLVDYLHAGAQVQIVLNSYCFLYFDFDLRSIAGTDFVAMKRELECHFFDWLQ